MNRLRRHLSYANVLSSICLFVVLSGGAYAAARVSLPKHSVGTAQIRAGAVRSRQVKDHSLLARDFRAGQLPAGRRGAPGPAGPQGATGATGPQGATGPVGPSEAFHVTTATGPGDIALSPGWTTVLALTLAPGDYVLSANLVASDQSTTTGSYVRCALFSDTDINGAENYPVFLAPGGMQTIPLQGIRVVAGASSTQLLQCRKDANVTVAIGEDPELTAIRVGAVSG